MQVKIKKLSAKARTPEYATAGSAGFDLCALEPCVIRANSTGLVRTGLSFEIQEGYELQIRPRSGLALNHKISVLNSPGTIDSDYRGEVSVILINHSDVDFVIDEGNRIAQGVIARTHRANFEIVEELEQTKRGQSGFGSSGI